MNGRDETPPKPASELEGLIRDKLPDPVRRHLIDVITDRTDVDGLGPNWTAQPVWSHDVSNNDKESSSAMFQTAPMRTLPVIFCLTCFFFPAIASAQLAPGLKAHAYDLSVAEIDAIKAAVTSILINPESARFAAIIASENEKTDQITVCGYVNAKNSSGRYAGNQPFKGVLKGKRFVITKPLGSSMTIIRCIYHGVPLLF